MISIKSFLRKNDYNTYLFICFSSIFCMLLEVIGISLIPLLIGFLSNSNDTINIADKFMFIKNINFNIQSFSFLNIILLLIFIFFLKNFFILFIKSREEILYSKISIYLTKKLFQNYLNFPYEYYIANNRSDMIRTIYSVGNINQYFRSFNYLINDIILVIFISLAMYFYNFTAFIIFLCLFVLFIIFYLLFIKKKIKFFSSNILTYESLKNKLINQGLLAFKESKILNIQPELAKNLDIVSSFIEKNNLHNKLLSIAPRYIIEIIFVLILAGSAYFLKMHNNADALVLLTFLTIAIIRSSAAIVGINRNLNSLNYSKPYFKLVNTELLKFQNELEEEKSRSTINKFEKSIEFKNISFKYKNSKIRNLENISFQIVKGDFVGIKGPSGSGKTTVINILLGLISYSEGHLVIDGVIVAKNAISFWGNIIGYVPQEPYLIDDTIINNIAFGVPKELINMDSVYNSIKLSSSDKFINNFPNKLNELVGENGIKLSGGQKQRIALARALYIQPKILVLDEATNALDNFLEDEVIKTIGLLKKKYTIIMISHRSSCFKDCDKIISLDQGKVISNFDCKK
jgi:ABC-type bacteriocin/lantibiotic exporter with double-glycine peptidase domain